MRKLIFILIALISFSQAQTIQYIGAPTTTVISRGNFRTDSIFYLPKRTKLPTDTAAFRYQISDSSLYYWTGYQWTKVQSSSSFASVDTTVISTRAYRQKGDDSLGAIIATKGSGTVTSVATGYGLSGGTITTTGTLIADTLNLSTRAWRQKGLDSLAALKISGSGTTNYVPKFTNTREIGNSQIFDNGTNVGIGTVSPSASVKLDINGITNFRGDLYLGTPSSINSRAYYFNATNTGRGEIYYDASNNNFRIESTYGGSGTSQPITFWTGFNERLRLTSSGELLINTTTDAGAYTLQNNGALYNTGGAILAATSGSVGIGTTSPARKLDVVGGHIKVDDGFSYMWGAASTSINGSSASNFIDFYTNSTAKARINSAGNFGVGTVNPVQKFVVSNGGAEGLEIIPDGIASTNLIQSYNRSTSAYNAIVMRASDYNIQIGTTAAYYINASQESLFGTLTDAGNYRVQVSGNAYISGNMAITGDATANGLTIAKPSSQGSEISLRGNNNSASTEFLLAQANDGTTTYIYNRANGRMYFGTNNTARLLIRSDGELLVNTETDNGAYILQLNGDMYTNGTITTGAPTDGTAAPFKIGSYVTTAPSATGFIQVQINGVKYKLLAATY